MWGFNPRVSAVARKCCGYSLMRRKSWCCYVAHKYRPASVRVLSFSTDRHVRKRARARVFKGRWLVDSVNAKFTFVSRAKALSIGFPSELFRHSEPSSPPNPRLIVKRTMLVFWIPLYTFLRADFDQIRARSNNFVCKRIWETLVSQCVVFFARTRIAKRKTLE